MKKVLNSFPFKKEMVIKQKKVLDEKLKESDVKKRNCHQKL